jgi:protein PsiE
MREGPMNDRSELPTREASAELRAPKVLKAIERALLILVGALTVVAAGLELAAIVANRTVTLADILLMFLYAEVIGMVAVFYTSRTIVVIYPIFIAITAIARLIVLQGKDMDPINIVFEAVAIFVLALAVLILSRKRDV